VANQGVDPDNTNTNDPENDQPINVKDKMFLRVFCEVGGVMQVRKFNARGKKGGGKDVVVVDKKVDRDPLAKGKMGLSVDDVITTLVHVGVTERDASSDDLKGSSEPSNPPKSLLRLTLTLRSHMRSCWRR